MNLLIKKEPLQVLPTLEIQGGLNEAILLQHLHFDQSSRRLLGMGISGFAKHMKSEKT